MLLAGKLLVEQSTLIKSDIAGTVVARLLPPNILLWPVQRTCCLGVKFMICAAFKAQWVLHPK